jgi:hypothetical protein
MVVPSISGKRPLHALARDAAAAGSLAREPRHSETQKIAATLVGTRSLNCGLVSTRQLKGRTLIDQY